MFATWPPRNHEGTMFLSYSSTIRSGRGSIATLLLAIGMLFSLVGPASAQVSTAAIAGVVTDPTGATISGAQIVATQVDTQISHPAMSDQNGNYTFPLLPVGSYSLKVSKEGFASFEQKGIVLVVGQSASIAVSLRVGATQQTVTVSADAAMVNTTGSETQALIGQRQVEGLPLTRNHHRSVNRNAVSKQSDSPGRIEFGNPKYAGIYSPAAPRDQRTSLLYSASNPNH